MRRGGSLARWGRTGRSEDDDRALYIAEIFSTFIFKCQRATRARMKGITRLASFVREIGSENGWCHGCP